MGFLSRLQRPRRSPDHRRFVAVGYPKVGNTWLRVMLGRYLQLLHSLPEMPLLDPAEVPGLVRAGVVAAGDFTHAPLEWETQTAADLTAEAVVQPFRPLKTVLLTRHPLDTLVSLYMQERHRNAARPYRGTLAEMMDDPVLGLEKLLRFHQIWCEHRQEVAGFMLWRYEDARADPPATLGELLRFLGEPVDASLIAEAAEYASFDNMRSMELSGQQPTYKSSGFAIFATGDASNPDALHVRKGQVGGWREALPAEVSARLEARIRAELPAFYGYC